MSIRTTYLIQTGGTIGMSKDESGTLNVDSKAQKGIAEILKEVPFTNYSEVSVTMRGDSSDHTRNQLIALGRTALDYADQKGGIIIAHGTDTMNLATATLALMGNEMWKYPVVFLGSIKDSGKEGSDARINALAAGLFAAHGDASGIFAVRPNGVVITSRHDTPGGAVDWHSRGIPQALDGYFAKINLEKLVDENENVIFKVERRKHSNSKMDLANIIKYQREFTDGTLDQADQLVVGGRGRLPNMQILGYGKKIIVRFKQRPEEDSPLKVANDILGIVKTEQSFGRFVGRIIPTLTFVEHVKRHKNKTDVFNEWWSDIMHSVTGGMGGLNLGWYIVDFWKRHSDIKNDEMDFSDLVVIDGSSDPDYLLRAFKKEPPSGVIMQATGASGLRLKYLDETFEPFLVYCKEQEIPVVLTSSSRGEVTSFEYWPGSYALEKDLVFFAGTMDKDLVLPRIALLNHENNSNFIRDLVDSLSVDDVVKKNVKRNIYRQLLSGSHYRRKEPSMVSDRERAEGLYGIESRIDLLSGVHVKKAILASFLHEVYRRGLNLSGRNVLENY